MADIHWTPSLIEERFVEAAEVMKRLPEVRVPGYFNTWPKMVVEFADRVGQEPAAAAAAAAVAGCHQPDGGNTWLAALARADRRQDRLAASHWRALEGDLLEGWPRPHGGSPALAIRAVRDRVETQWTQRTERRGQHIHRGYSCCASRE